jgi:RNA-directed DNA polymerase
MLTQGQTRWSILPSPAMPDSLLLRALARSFLAGEPTVEQLVTRGARTLGQPWRWLRPLAQRYVNVFGGRTRPRQRDVVQFFLHDRGLKRARSKYFHELSVEHHLAERQPMQPVGAAETWDIPAIESAGALAEWLGLNPSQLRWLADLKGLGCKKAGAKLWHYHYRILAKSYGSIRLIEAPKPRLKELQRQILTQILEKVPPHSAAHGFIKGRSIKTFVAPHLGQRVILRMDLQDFFPSFRAARIQAFFRTLGYPESVAELLGGVCTNATPRDAWKEAIAEVDPLPLSEARILYARPHLPQGAPTSPALANLCTYRVDCRLSGLARSAGAEYTRYADDLAFSGSADLEKHIDRFSTHVAAVLMEEGFAVHFRKTRVMRRGVRQHLAGIVVNQHPNVIRADFDRIKATLANCARLGPESQNRDGTSHFRAHLEGRVSFVEMINPNKGRRLRALFDRIQWQ